MRSGRGALRRTIRRVGGRWMRRLGLVPEGTPDGLGEDAALAGTTLEQQVMVFFPDTRTNLYQLRQWYAPLRELDRTHPVLLVFQDSRAAGVVRSEVDLPAIVVGRSAVFDDLLSRGQVKLCLYVSHLARNFLALRHTNVIHVYLGHGESDKEVSASNQIKAYDFCFVAGRAAVERIAAGTILYDAEQHLVRIGRPQLDDLDGRGDIERPEAPGDGRRRTVLYAPTWEGAQPSVAYGSVESHGARLVGELLDSGRFRVIYRPHPRTGANQAGHADADRAVRARVDAAVSANPTAGHRVDTAPDPRRAFAEAELLVCDVSAVAFDWLPSGRPLVVTTPVAASARISGTALLDAVPRLDVADLGRAADLVTEQLERDPGRARRRELVDYYFGDTTPGAATKRFVAACTDAIHLRDAELARHPRAAGRDEADAIDDAGPVGQAEQEEAE